MVVTIIGGGHIGGACALGFDAAGAACVRVTARHRETLERFRGTGISVSQDNATAVRDADFVLLAVKTAQVPEALESIRDVIDWKKQTLVCLAAQVQPDELVATLGGKMPGQAARPRLLYAIPNTAVEIGRGVTFLADVRAGEEAMVKARELFSAVGIVQTVPMSLLPAGIALASCGAGYALKYIASAAATGEKMGFGAEEAARIVAQTVLGTSDLLLRGECDPVADLRRVATPGGMTEKGVKAMEDAGFDGAVEAGLTANL